MAAKDPEEMSPEELDQDIKAAFDKLNFMRGEFDSMWNKSTWSQDAKRGKERMEQEEKERKEKEKK